MQNLTSERTENPEVAVSAPVAPEAETSWWKGQSGTPRRLRTALERFRNRQLRDGSVYTAVRVFVPVATLGILWLRYAGLKPIFQIGPLLNHSETLRHVLIAGGVFSLWNLILSLSLFERRSLRVDLVAEVRRLVAASVLCGVFLFVCEVAQHRVSLGISLMGVSIAALVLTGLAAIAIFVGLAAISPRTQGKRAAIIVGSGHRSQRLRETLLQNDSRIDFFGCVDNEYLGSKPDEDFYLGRIDDLPELLKANPIEIVLVALPIRSKYDEIQQVIDICETIGVETRYTHDLFETGRARLQVKPEDPHHFSVITTTSKSPLQHVKRIIDFSAALFLLILASPIMILAALAVRLSSPGPIFFVQQRYGLHRKRFPMFKFRSMVVDAERRQAALEAQNEAQGPVFKLRRDPRVTPVGSFLRKTSIDELPQLFNVLRGEMSLVGPRPLPLRDVSKFQEPWLLRRFSVRPGLTCIWQVNGRSNTTFDDWMRQDLAYIDSWSLGLDFNILFRTVPAVLRGSGAV